MCKFNVLYYVSRANYEYAVDPMIGTAFAASAYDIGVTANPYQLHCAARRRAHCKAGARSVFSVRAFDWLDSVLKR